jgi:hypothetical protein
MQLAVSIMKYISTHKYVFKIMREDSTVSKVASYGLDDQGLNFPPQHSNQTGSGAHHAPYFGKQGLFLQG